MVLRNRRLGGITLQCRIAEDRENNHTASKTSKVNEVRCILLKILANIYLLESFAKQELIRVQDFMYKTSQLVRILLYPEVAPSAPKDHGFHSDVIKF